MTERFTGERYSPWHLLRKPEPYPIDRSLEQELAIEFRSPDRNREREKALAVAIIQGNTSGLSYHDAFQRLFNLFARINSIHFGTRKGALSKTRSDAKFNSIQSHMIARLALDRAMEVPDSYVDKLTLQAASLSSKDGVDSIDNWYYPKVEGLANEINASKWTRGWIKKLSERVGPAIKGKEDEIRQDAEEVWKQVVADRAYGIKNCFFGSPLFFNDSHVFYVMDRSLGLEDPLLQKEYLPSDIEVVIGIGERPKGMTPQLQVSDIKIGNTIKYHRIEFGPLHTICAVTSGGDIRTNVTNLFSLRESFEAEGNVGLFHLLRLFMFMRLYDLTARAVTVNKLPSIGRLEGEIARNRTGLLRLGKEVKPFNYKTLLLPRIKPIADEPDPTPQTLDQNEEVQRFVDRHKVTWFIRRLPDGYHSSETAKQYALEHGVTLKEQETIVREHFRGKETNKPERPIKAEFRRKK